MSWLMANFVLYWKPAVEIIILWFVIYEIMLFFEDTRARQALRGIVIFLLAFFTFQKLNLGVLDWLFTKLLGISIIAVLIIFHPEIRQGLARLGQRHIFGKSLKREEFDNMLQQMIQTAKNLLKNKYGAIIVVENNDPLTAYIESGVPIDAKFSPELIEAIFTPNNILHDGGIIIQHNRIAAAGCFFPLTQKTDLNRIYGTRHRAALGLSEETDAVIIIVSEERLDISLAYKGELYNNLNEDRIAEEIKRVITTKK